MALHHGLALVDAPPDEVCSMALHLYEVCAVWSRVCSMALQQYIVCAIWP